MDIIFRASQISARRFNSVASRWPRLQARLFPRLKKLAFPHFSDGEAFLLASRSLSHLSPTSGRLNSDDYFFFVFLKHEQLSPRLERCCGLEKAASLSEDYAIVTFIVFFKFCLHLTCTIDLSNMLFNIYERNLIIFAVILRKSPSANNDNALAKPHR